MIKKIILWVAYEMRWLWKTKEWEIIEEWHNPVYRPNLHNYFNPTAVITWKNNKDGAIREQIIIL